MIMRRQFFKMGHKKCVIISLLCSKIMPCGKKYKLWRLLYQCLEIHDTCHAKRIAKVLKTHILEPCLKVLAPLCYNDEENICVIKTNESQAATRHNILKTHILEPSLNVLAPLYYNDGKNICVIKTNEPHTATCHWLFWRRHLVIRLRIFL